MYKKQYMKKYMQEHREELNAYTRQYRLDNKEKIFKIRERYRAKQYGLTVEKAKEMRLQNCEICNISPLDHKIKMCIDHDHSKPRGQHRGVLCHTCNVKVGWLENNKDKIFSYLKLEIK